MGSYAAPGAATPLAEAAARGGSLGVGLQHADLDKLPELHRAYLRQKTDLITLLFGHACARHADAIA